MDVWMSKLYRIKQVQKYADKLA